MWLSVVAMFLPNVLLFSLAWTMVSNVFDAGQGIGVVEAMLILPFALIFDPDSGIGFVISALIAPIPFFGMIGWLAGQFIGRTA